MYSEITRSSDMIAGRGVTHGWCIARAKVTFPASRRHCTLTGTKLYCLVTDAPRCK